MLILVKEVTKTITLTTVEEIDAGFLLVITQLHQPHQPVSFTQIEHKCKNGYETADDSITKLPVVEYPVLLSSLERLISAGKIKLVIMSDGNMGFMLKDS